jgi:hypothetical protein
VLQHEVLPEVEETGSLLFQGLQALVPRGFRELNVFSGHNLPLLNYPFSVPDVSDLVSVEELVVLSCPPNQVVNLIAGKGHKDFLDFKNLFFNILWNFGVPGEKELFVKGSRVGSPMNLRTASIVFSIFFLKPAELSMTVN